MVSRRGANGSPSHGPTLWRPSAVLLAVAGATVAADLWTAVGRRQLLAWACAALVVLASAWAISLLRLLRAERARREAEDRVSQARAAEVVRLASVRLPAITERLRAGASLDSAPGPLATGDETGEEFARALAEVAEALGSDEAVRRERVLRDSVQAAFESVARHMHAMATVQQQVLDRVEQAIEEPRLMAEVMKADHAAAQMTRKAQTLLVMCGIWPARRETQPVSLYDCVRGAQSRIVEFNRIEVHGGQTLYVVPPAVEGLMHALAELLENATVFSPSRTQVVVTVREVGSGAVVEVDDAGLGMPPDVLRQSTARLRDELDLAELGAVPRLGLACVGRWSRELGFSVELTGTSAYGGTRAVTFVPYRLLTEPLSHFSSAAGGTARARNGAVAPGRPRAPRPPSHEPPPRHEPRDREWGARPDAYRHAAVASAMHPGPAGGPPAPPLADPDSYPSAGPDPYPPGNSDPYTSTSASSGPYSPVDSGPYSGPYSGTDTVPASSGGPRTSDGADSFDPYAGEGGGRAPYARHTDYTAYTDYTEHTAYGDNTEHPDHRDVPQHASPRPGQGEGRGRPGAEAAAPHPGGAHGEGRGEAGALPRRQSRRGAAVEAAARMALQSPQPAAPELPDDRPAWTPEAARASITSVVSGARRGRAAVADARAPRRPPPSPPTTPPDPQHGGRS